VRFLVEFCWSTNYSDGSRIIISILVLPCKEFVDIFVENKQAHRQYGRDEIFHQSSSDACVLVCMISILVVHSCQECFPFIFVDQVHRGVPSKPLSQCADIDGSLE
jgi:hypothetical protein